LNTTDVKSKIGEGTTFTITFSQVQNPAKSFHMAAMLKMVFVKQMNLL
jgi:hypothetical protein